jgi:hypothetical protein
LCFCLALPVLDASSVPLAQGIATGKYHAAVLTNSAEWEAACVKAGRQCGDLVHPLVYCPELHFSEFTSAVADMKNSVAVGLGPGQGGESRPVPQVCRALPSGSRCPQESRGAGGTPMWRSDCRCVSRRGRQGGIQGFTARGCPLHRRV